VTRCNVGTEVATNFANTGCDIEIQSSPSPRVSTSIINLSAKRCDG
jgi:hypothetical protein